MIQLCIVLSKEFLRRASGIAGVYVPSLYAPRYEENGDFRGTERLDKH